MIAGLGMINAALVASIGLSLAWYSTGAVLYVHQIEVSFRGDKKIYVGLDEDTDNYKETMVFGDKEHSKNYYPISSMFSDEWINEKASKPRFRSEYTSISHNDVDSYTKSDLITVDEDGYFSKEIYLYCESNVVLTLDSEQTTFTPDEEGNRKTAHNLAGSSSEEEQIYLESVALNINGILVLYEKELFAKLEDEVADIIYNLVLQHLFIYVLNVIGIQFLHIDKIQKVFVFECTDCTTGAPGIRDSCEKVVGKGTAMMVIIRFDGLNDSFLCQMRHRRKTNVEDALLSFLHTLNNASVLCKRNRQKLGERESY